MKATKGRVVRGVVPAVARVLNYCLTFVMTVACAGLTVAPLFGQGTATLTIVKTGTSWGTSSGNVILGKGTITSNPPGINCGPVCTASFPVGTTVTLKAIPDQDSLFVCWNSTGLDCFHYADPYNDNTYVSSLSLTVVRPTVIQAHFNLGSDSSCPNGCSLSLTSFDCTVSQDGRTISGTATGTASLPASEVGQVPNNGWLMFNGIGAPYRGLVWTSGTFTSACSPWPSDYGLCVPIGSETTSWTVNYSMTYRDPIPPNLFAMEIQSGLWGGPDYADAWYKTDCSSSCGDERDKIIQEYKTTYTVLKNGQLVSVRPNFVPRCEDFTKNSTGQAQTANYKFSELNTSVDPSTGQPYPWAIIRSSLVAPASAGYGLDAWVKHLLDLQGRRSLTSAYRNPDHNFKPLSEGGAGSTAAYSRHMFGDAADMQNLAGTACGGSAVSPSLCPQGVSEYWTLYYAARRAHASWIEPLPVSAGGCGLGCVHAQWVEQQPDTYINP